MHCIGIQGYLGSVDMNCFLSEEMGKRPLSLSLSRFNPPECSSKSHAVNDRNLDKA